MTEPIQWRPPTTCLPAWGTGTLDNPPLLSWSRWRSFIGPGIVMMGVQIGGGEWLFGPEITARFGGGLMWLATVAIVLQVFYNMEVGRYALYCGEPIFTGFLRTRPGPMFWVAFFVLLSLGAIVPGLAFHAATALSSLYLDRPPTEADREFVLWVAYACVAGVFVPVLFGGKVYSTLELIMSIKVFGVLLFCLGVGLLLVPPMHWWNVVSGFFKFGSLPSPDAPEGEALVNVFRYRVAEGKWPEIGLAEISVIGAFVGYSGGGGLANSLYGNFVRDKGWGMGSQVGAIPGLVGGRNIPLSHLGKIFELTSDNLQRWKGWWKVIIVDQIFVWAPGCFVGMALPALISLQFAANSPLFSPLPAASAAQVAATPTESGPATQAAAQPPALSWANAVISADGMRRASELSPRLQRWLWTTTLLVGLLVLLPSQMSTVDEVSRRWTDVIWSASSWVRATMQPHQVKYVYYSLCGAYFLWCMGTLYGFGKYGTPRLMTLVVANLGNLAIGYTALHILYINCCWLPPQLRPRWYQRCGLACCGVFYLGMSGLVFVEKQLPMLRELLEIYWPSQS